MMGGGGGVAVTCMVTCAGNSLKAVYSWLPEHVYKLDSQEDVIQVD